MYLRLVVFLGLHKPTKSILELVHYRVLYYQRENLSNRTMSELRIPQHDNIRNVTNQTRYR